jgi:Na+/H+-dicarboxylate symporter
VALHWQILIALLAGGAVGLATGPDGVLWGVPLMGAFAFLGTLFLNALKMLIVPLVMASLIVGVGNMRDTAGLGRLGAKTVVYYLVTSLIAILIGLAWVNAAQPGVMDGRPAGEVLGLEADGAEVADRVRDKGAGDLVAVFLRMVPPNIVQAAADGQMLGLIFFSLLFGYFVSRLQGEPGRTLHAFWQGVYEVMMRMTELIMRLAPVGVFGLVAKTLANAGLSALLPLAGFFLTVVGALAMHLFVALPLLLRFVGGVSPWRHFKAMLPALLTAFSTSSSSATLPITLESVEKRAGVSNRTGGFVLPLGATINMDGTALYECVAALFIAQAYGLELTFAQQFTVVLAALLTSIGVAGIPSASLVAITIILAAIGLPAEGIGLILAVDRLLDMSRTAVNVFSDSCGAVIIARSEGETEVLAEDPDERVRRLAAS